VRSKIQNTVLKTAYFLGGALRQQWKWVTLALSCAALGVTYHGWNPSIDRWSAPLEYPTKGMHADLDRAQFTSAAVCGRCHETHYQQWQRSGMGRSSATSRFLVELFEVGLDLRGAPPEDVEQCLRCHAPLATIGTPQDLGMQQAISQEGVTCDVCHTAVAAAANDAPGMLRWDPTGPKRGPLPGDDALDLPGLPPAKSPFHRTKRSPLHESSELCGACHMSMWPTNALPIDWTYAEWKRSPYAARGVSCQDCHMPTYKGFSAPGAPLRTLHDHSFAGGGDVALVTGTAELRVRTVAHFAGHEIEIEVENTKSAHAFPTGNATAPVVTLEVSALNPAGELVWSDHRDFRVVYVDAHGDVTNDPTTATKLKSDTTLQPLEPRHERFFLPHSLGAATIEAELVYKRWSDELLNDHAGVLWEQVSRYLAEGVRVHRLVANLAALDYAKLDAVRSHRAIVVSRAHATLGPKPELPAAFRQQ
jgi:nitrate/TMAO reductase-like tetraheme cytochrome c subunit